MKRLLLVTFLSIFFPLHIFANSIFSCEAKRVSGDSQTLDLVDYKNIIYPTIIIDKEKDTLLYIYSEHEQQWEQKYKILHIDENHIMGVEKFQIDWASVIHFNLKKKEFSTVFAGYTGNTLTFGKCYDD